MTFFWLTIKCVGLVEKFQKLSAHHWFRFLTIKSNDIITLILPYLCVVWLHLKDAFMRIRNVPGERGWLTNPVALLSLSVASAGLALAEAAVAEGGLLQPPLPLHGGTAPLPSPGSPVEHRLEAAPQRGSALPASPSFFYLHAGWWRSDWPSWYVALAVVTVAHMLWYPDWRDCCVYCYQAASAKPLVRLSGSEPGYGLKLAIVPAWPSWWFNVEWSVEFAVF